MISHSYHYCSLITDCLKKISETGLPGDEIKLATQFPDGDLRSMVSKFNSMPSTLRESFTQDYSSVNISENEKDNKISWKIYLAEVGALNTAFAATQSCVKELNESMKKQRAAFNAAIQDAVLKNFDALVSGTMILSDTSISELEDQLQELYATVGEHNPIGRMEKIQFNDKNEILKSSTFVSVAEGVKSVLQYRPTQALDLAKNAQPYVSKDWNGHAERRKAFSDDSDGLTTTMSKSRNDEIYRYFGLSDLAYDVFDEGSCEKLKNRFLGSPDTSLQMKVDRGPTGFYAGMAKLNEGLRYAVDNARRVEVHEFTMYNPLERSPHLPAYLELGKYAGYSYIEHEDSEKLKAQWMSLYVYIYRKQCILLSQVDEWRWEKERARPGKTNLYEFFIDLVTKMEATLSAIDEMAPIVRKMLESSTTIEASYTTMQVALINMYDNLAAGQFIDLRNDYQRWEEAATTMQNAFPSPEDIGRDLINRQNVDVDP